MVVKVHLLDVGTAEYGDAVLCELGDRRILIDGGHQGDLKGSPGHASIPDQLDDHIDGPRPHDIDLIVISHAHDDHIGCMPELVSQGVINPGWAFVTDAQLGWGRSGDDADDGPLDPRVARVVAALREEPLSPDAPDSVLRGFMDAAVNVETRYKQMIATLRRNHVPMVRHGRDKDLQPLHDGFADIGLKVLGPTREFLLFCADEIHARTSNGIDAVSGSLAADAATSLPDLYRRLSSEGGGDAADASASRPGNFVNLQSSVISFDVDGVKLLFGGDSQLVDPDSAKPQVTAERDRLVQAIADDGPYTWAKLGHHGSPNSVSEDLLTTIGAKVVGICAGSRSKKHPDGDVLQTMAHHMPKLKSARQ